MEDILSAKSGIGGFFSNFGTALARGDWSVKLSLLWWGAGYARRRQFAKDRKSVV